MLFSFCVAFRRYIITKNYADPIAIPAKNQRCQPPLSAGEAKKPRRSYAHKDKRGTAYRIPKAKFWRIRYLLPNRCPARLLPAIASVVL
ncbi:hypothetical protein KCP77_22375 [Salmonella enterica subsp. enterica]|nr:hypothetical protein KCP77_22375 [Salmonella enterica subsp. enterica]